MPTRLMFQLLNNLIFSIRDDIQNIIQNPVSELGRQEKTDIKVSL